MRHVLPGLVLSPVLAYQAWRTRKTVPRLPEAPGPREGKSGQGPPLRILIVGDSAAAGVGAAHQDEALSGQLLACLESRYCAEWRLIARTGATTASTIKRLLRESSSRFDVAVTSLGVNDVTSLVRCGQWLDQQATLRAVLRSYFGVRLIVSSGLPPVHGFPALPQPLRWYLGSRATLFDRSLEAAVAGEPDCSFLSLRFTGDVRNMASDGFHPGPPVYREWALRAGRAIDEAFGSTTA